MRHQRSTTMACVIMSTPPPLLAQSRARLPPLPPTRPRHDGMENVSEDGSLEGSVDWWPRPLSPLPTETADPYYAGAGDCYDNPGVSAGLFVGDPAGQASRHHHFMKPSLGGGKQGATSILPAVPTFEESGTRVSWADMRGHRLAEVHEIEPGYSREDFALPGRVGFITEVSAPCWARPFCRCRFLYTRT